MNNAWRTTCVLLVYKCIIIYMYNNIIPSGYIVDYFCVFTVAVLIKVDIRKYTELFLIISMCC